MRPISRRTFAQGTALGLLHWAGIPKLGSAQPQSAAGVTIAADAKPAVTLVTADQPEDSIRYAASELAWHIAKAIGFRPAIVTESAVPSASDGHPNIFLGDTRFARKAGVEVSALGAETCVIRTVGKDLCIAGSDGPGAALDENTSAGTLFGIYEVLDRYFGVRWLWPGELGTFVPQARSIFIPAADMIVAPHFMQRRVRSGAGLKSKQHPEMGFTVAATTEYLKAQTIFLRRHRMGRRLPGSYGHAFVDWWEKYGAKHPEWFQLVRGKRGPARPGARFSMCISNDGLREEIVRHWRQRDDASPGRFPGFVNAVENDIPGQCECAVCRALDGPEPPDYRKFLPAKSKIARKPFVSDRYARSWLAIQQKAAKADPGAIVVGYAYMNYFVPPTSGVKLNQNILIGFCPSSWYYPRNDEEQNWMKRQWRGWAETGAKVLMRANYFLDGYCMPHIFGHQFADEFQNAVGNGMVGTDFDSLTGHWATQGPNLYLLMRLQTRPEMDVDSLMSEYYSAFGPAANDVRAYFDYWESYTSKERSNLRDTFEALQVSRWRNWAKAAHAIYPEESFAPAEALLDRASVSAAEDPETAMRVGFLKLGLEHAKLCSRAAGKLTLGDPTSTYERGKSELQALVEFRRSHERTWISNMNHCAWVEARSWVLPGLSVRPSNPDAD